MLDTHKPYTFDRVIRIGITVALFWALIRLLGFLSDVLIPFAIALLLAYLINPLVVFVQKKVHKRAPAVFISLSIVFLFFCLLAFLLVPVIVNEAANMGRVVTDVVQNSEVAKRAAESLPPNIWEAIKDLLAKEKTSPELKQAALSLFSGTPKSNTEEIESGMFNTFIDWLVEKASLHQLEYCLALHAEENAILQSANIVTTDLS